MKNILWFLVAVCSGVFISIVILSVYITSKNVQQRTSAIVQAKTMHFSLEKAPADSIQGSIASLSGTVAWQSRIATQPAQITQSRIIQQGETIVTKDDGNATIAFSELGTIALFPETTLAIIQTLPENAVFVQQQGSAMYTKTGNTPVTIRSLHLLTLLTSGKAEITINTDQPVITVRVYNGLATIGFNTLKYLSVVQEIPAGQQVTFHDDTREITMESLTQ